MNLSPQGLEFIVSFEGKLKPIGDGRYQAYRCPAGRWTIYTGCTEGVHEGMIVTEAEGKAMFARELEKHRSLVERLVTVDLTQGQADALISFSYNCGGLQGSTLLKKLNRGDVLGAADQFRYWNKGDEFKNGKKTGRKVVMPGLVRRRKAEAALFVSDMPGSEAMPQAATESKPVSGATIAGAATAGTAVVSQAVPGVPTAVTNAADTASAWRSVGEQVADLGSFVVARPLLSVPLIATVIVLGWLAPKWARNQEGTDA